MIWTAVEQLYVVAANWFLVVFATLGTLLCGQALMKQASEFRNKEDPDVIALEMAYKQQQFVSILRRWRHSKGEGAIAALRDQLKLDYLFPVLYGVAAASFIAAATAGDEPPDRFILALFVLPLLAAAFDILPENTTYLVLLRGVDDDVGLSRLPAWPIALASVAARIKIGLLILAVLGVVAVGFTALLPVLFQVLANWVLFVVAFSTFLLYANYIFPRLALQYRSAMDPSGIRLQLSFSKERFTEVLHAWYDSRGPGAIPRYRQGVGQHDYIFPVVYGVMLASAIAILSARGDEPPAASTLTFFALPLLAAIFDWIENAFLMVVLRGVDSRATIDAIAERPVMLASGAALVKISLLIVALVGTLGLLVARAIG